MALKDPDMTAMMLERIAEAFPELPAGRTLLAVSGGVDSVVMAHLFAAAAWPFALAHCNFRLRGAAAEGDEAFVRALADKWQVPYYSVSFATEKEAEEAGVSIQMIARSLRYDWLERVRLEHDFRYIATGHHLNDSIETSLINQTRGTGIRGIAGIPVRQGALIRPMMVFTRAELAAYAAGNGIAYREDSSNSEHEYHRNRIRHQVIPVLQSINPSLEATFRKNLRIWKESAWLLEWACHTLKARYVSESEGGVMRIDYQFIRYYPEAGLTLLYEWLKPWGFHAGQVEQALSGAGRNTGALWLSATHRLLADREAFLVEPLAAGGLEPAEVFLPQANMSRLLPDGAITARLAAERPSLTGQGPVRIAHLDADLVHFPLTVRRWRPGDRFCPLGMNGRHKKVQDLFTDLKLSRFEKERVWLVEEAGGAIVWVAGLRIDERYKITERTERVLVLRLELSDG